RGPDLRPSSARASPATPTGPADLRLAAHAAPTSGPRAPARRPQTRPARRISAWLLMRLRPPALERPRVAGKPDRPVASPPRCSCGFDPWPPGPRPPPANPRGPPDLRLAARAACTA